MLRMTEIQLRNSIVGTAEAFVGIKRGSTEHKHIVDVYNSTQGGYRMSYTEPWCATFVSAIGIMCGLNNIIFKSASCTNMIAQYKNAERWIEDDTYIPNIGDIVMYYWGDGTNYATTDQKNNPNHVGIVVKVYNGGFDVVEGNMTVNGVSSVGIRKMKVNGRYIRGFCIPDYASMAIENNFEKKEDDEDMTGEEIYNRLVEYLSSQNAPDWAKKEYKEAIDKGITDGTRPMMFTTRLETSIMAKRAAEKE